MSIFNDRGFWKTLFAAISVGSGQAMNLEYPQNLITFGLAIALAFVPAGVVIAPKPVEPVEPTV